MGIWDFTVSTIDRLQSKQPFVNSIKNSGEKLKVYIPDQDQKAHIGSFATKFIKNAAAFFVKEGYELIPGGKAVAKIVSVTTREMEAENDHGASKKMASSGNKGNEKAEGKTKDLKISSQDNNRTEQLIVNSNELVKSAVPAISEGTGGSPTSIRSKL